MKLIDRVLEPISWLAAALVLVLLFAGPSLIGAEKEQGAAAAGGGGTGGPPAGEAVFKANCGVCHTLEAAGTSGVAGPNLDQAKPDAPTITAIVTDGGSSMPSFAGKLGEAEITAVAEYVATSAGG